ncbi:peptide-methionine (S)-S-oxide reductase [Shewanella salipaludis]|uniref:peptide-methionine (S)-S-oxide reductase n=1 Tax=Shewanella salipaludis TaxID=2723052 RepID=A0A972JLS0_9GAMM|nr:peptide-methionine (S)-S-oxide reductase [Shewanella salipaludis]NMH66474.1 peptide methionine sulfoxide reductase [Shewanella salipaludis]
MITKIALGGSCHWCSEAIFRSLKGVVEVEQGWLAAGAAPAGSPTYDNASRYGEDDFCEGVVVHFDPEQIALATLVEIHLHSHGSTVEHGGGRRYRSAVYAYDAPQLAAVADIIAKLQNEFEAPLLTRALGFGEFRLSRESIRDYYYADPDKPFCRVRIQPRLMRLLQQFGEYLDCERKAQILAAARTPE